MRGEMKLVLGLAVFVTLCALRVTRLNAQLSDSYYNQSGHYCPQAGFLIGLVVSAAVAQDRGIAAKLLRLHFHDCFVRGCDGSVMIVKANKTAEMDGLPNANSLGGFDVINNAKAVVEAACPKIVSCADIIALAARDAVVALGNPFVTWDVPLGRSDGNYSFASEANVELPAPFFNGSQLIAKFQSKGLSIQQMVALSGLLDNKMKIRALTVADRVHATVWIMDAGAHTIGTANCTVSNGRLYGPGGTDPTLNPAYANYLKGECPNNIQTKRIAMKDFLDNPFSNNGTFDNQYYVNLEEHKGLFTSDAALVADPDTKPYVDLYFWNGIQFISDFGSSMVAMGKVQVIMNGYARGNCNVPFS